jgi:hypothetical protein
MQTPHTRSDASSARTKRDQSSPLKRVTWTYPLDIERESRPVPKTPILKSPKVSTLQGTPSKRVHEVKVDSTATDGYNLRPRSSKSSYAGINSTRKALNPHHRISKSSHSRIPQGKSAQISKSGRRDSSKLLTVLDTLDSSSKATHMKHPEENLTPKQESVWFVTECLSRVFGRTS